MKILKVIDTRSYEEINDKWFPIPGSGEDNICARCGKSHEVHYYVEVSGKTEIVGGGCAKLAGMISEAQHKSLGSAAITLAKNRAELEKMIPNFEVRTKIIVEVYKLKLPEITKEDFKEKKYWIVMEDSRVLVDDSWMKLDERKSNLIYGWRQNRIDERTKTIPGFKEVHDFQIEECRKRIKRAEQKIQKLMEGK